MNPASDVVHDRHFENGVVKVQRREERTLFSAEKAALAHYKIDAGDGVVDDEEVYFIKRVYAVKKAKPRPIDHSIMLLPPPTAWSACSAERS